MMTLVQAVLLFVGISQALHPCSLLYSPQLWCSQLPSASPLMSIDVSTASEAIFLGKRFRSPAHNPNVSAGLWNLVIVKFY